MENDWFEKMKKDVFDYIEKTSKEELQQAIDDAGYDFYKDVTEQDFWRDIEEGDGR